MPTNEKNENTLTLQQTLSMWVKVIFNLKIIMLIFSFVFLLWGIGWDNTLRPGLEQMSHLDQALSEQQKQVQGRADLEKQYVNLDRDLKELDSILLPISDRNSSPKVLAISEAAALLNMIKGKDRDARLGPSLPAPNDERVNVSIEPTTSSTIDLLKPEGDTASSGSIAASATAPPSMPAAAGTPPASPGPASTTTAPGVSPAVTGTAMTPLGSSTLMVHRFDYEVKVTGTYIALIDVLNELLIHKNLIRLNKITITRPANAEPQPNAADFPDYPVKLEMIMSISFYLYENYV